MGNRGPIPKRKTELNGHRSRAELDGETVTTAAGADRVPVPAAARDWHPIAKRLWNAMKQSGQARFYEPSDWAYAYSLMDDLSYYKNGSKRSGQMLASIYSAMEKLLITEGDRRRVQIELSRPGDDAEGDSEGTQEAQAWITKLRAV